MTPLSIKDPKKPTETFPADCGKCPDCVKKRVSQWSFRLRKEAEVSTSALFLTLTYNTQNVPITPHGFMTLQPEDITLWLKQLRKLHWHNDPVGEINKPLKYYYVGEYGTKTWRPHYHMILFNAKIELIEQAYKYGSVHYVNEINGATIGYMLKYIIKDSRIPLHANDDRLPELGRMSKGLGRSYINQSTLEYHKHNRSLLDRCHLIQDGKKVSIPRYYKDRLYTDQQRLVLQHQSKLLLEKKWAAEALINPQQKIEADKAKFSKMLSSKYKNKYVD